MATATLSPVEYPAQASAEDRALFDRVAALCPVDGKPTRAQFDQVLREFGLDFATAWLCLSLRATAAARAMIAQMEGTGADRNESPPRLLIVPGAFYRHHRN